MSRLRGFLRLMRPANVVTAISDVLAGAAIAGGLVSVVIPGIPFGSPLGQVLLHGASPLLPLFLLALATACLYAGGVVLNDYFDAALDAVERPERPIPSGLIGRRKAAALGYGLLFAGILTAALADFFKHLAYREPFTLYSASLAAMIAIASVVYDKWGKHHRLLGPLNMGTCRGLNLLLGISIFSGYALYLYWPLMLVPVIYIAAITMISRGEVHGGKKLTLYAAAVLYAAVLSAIVFLSYLNHTLPQLLLFLALFAAMIFRPLITAIRSPQGKNIGRAVKSGVIALIVMNACWAAAFDDMYLAILTLLLLPLSLWLARLFAVT